MGGSGGSGGDSGNVLVKHSGSITSHGDNAYGIFAQTVGGGGGSVGTSISSPIWTAADLGISAIVGGRDGSAGQAGTVTVNTTGNISMFGANSQAQFTQAVSGGGGDLELFLDISRTAVGLGDGGFVLPNNDGILEKISATGRDGRRQSQRRDSARRSTPRTSAISTPGARSRSPRSCRASAAAAEMPARRWCSTRERRSISSWRSAPSTRTTRAAATSRSTRTGGVQTAGDQSQGVSVQSIGGGGGRAVVDVRSVQERTTAPGATTSTATVGLGADPSFGNNGGNMNLELNGSTVTLGDYSPGLVLQSIGAGGGQAFLSGLASATVNIGAIDGSTGNGGNIQLSNTGAIATAGELSDGIVLQSIGGGGGYVITDLKPSDVTVNARRGNEGDGGNIDFTQIGDIVVTGDRSRGVFAQSIGGGGGIVDGVFSGTAGGDGRGGSIALRLEGDVVASGAGVDRDLRAERGSRRWRHHHLACSWRDRDGRRRRHGRIDRWRRDEQPAEQGSADDDVRRRRDGDCRNDRATTSSTTSEPSSARSISAPD